MEAGCLLRADAGVDPSSCSLACDVQEPLALALLRAEPPPERLLSTMGRELRCHAGAAGHLRRLQTTDVDGPDGRHRCQPLPCMRLTPATKPIASYCLRTSITFRNLLDGWVGGLLSAQHAKEAACNACNRLPTCVSNEESDAYGCVQEPARPRSWTFWQGARQVRPPQDQLEPVTPFWDAGSQHVAPRVIGDIATVQHWLCTRASSLVRHNACMLMQLLCTVT